MIGDRRNVHLLAHHDGSGALIDHDSRGRSVSTVKCFQLGDEFRGARGELGGNGDADQPGVVGVRDRRRAGGEALIHGFGDAGRGGEIGAGAAAAALLTGGAARAPRARRSRRSGTRPTVG